MHFDTFVRVWVGGFKGCPSDNLTWCFCLRSDFNDMYQPTKDLNSNDFNVRVNE